MDKKEQTYKKYQTQIDELNWMRKDRKKKGERLSTSPTIPVTKKEKLKRKTEADLS